MFISIPTKKVYQKFIMISNSQNNLFFDILLSHFEHNHFIPMIKLNGQWNQLKTKPLKIKFIKQGSCFLKLYYSAKTNIRVLIPTGHTQ